MMFKHILLTAILLISSYSYSQYKYEVTVTNPGNESSKSIYSKICKRIDFTNRKIEGNQLFFYSKNKYSLEKMEEIVRIAGYELILFEVKSIKEESVNSRFE